MILSVFLLLNRTIQYPCNIVSQLDEIIAVGMLHLHLTDPSPSVDIHFCAQILCKFYPKFSVAAGINDDSSILQFLLGALKDQATHILIETLSPGKLRLEMPLSLLIDHNAIVEEIVRCNRMEECPTDLLRIAIEVELAFPTQLPPKQLNALITCHGILPIFKHDQSNREESARSLIELKARIAGLIDKEEHGKVP